MHVPHYVHMFERVLAGPKPFLYGHLYTPGGSESLGRPEYALHPGTQAPLVGTLMHVLAHDRLPDGRIIIIACGVGRFKVGGFFNEIWGFGSCFFWVWMFRVEFGSLLGFEYRFPKGSSASFIAIAT